MLRNQQKTSRCFQVVARPRDDRDAPGMRCTPLCFTGTWMKAAQKKKVLNSAGDLTSAGIHVALKALAWLSHWLKVTFFSSSRFGADLMNNRKVSSGGQTSRYSICTVVTEGHLRFPAMVLLPPSTTQTSTAGLFRPGRTASSGRPFGPRLCGRPSRTCLSVDDRCSYPEKV